MTQWKTICLPRQEDAVRSLGGEDPLEAKMATDSSILAWRIPRTEEPGGLQSMEFQRIRHDLATKQLQHSIQESGEEKETGTVGKPHSGCSLCWGWDSGSALAVGELRKDNWSWFSDTQVVPGMTQSCSAAGQVNYSHCTQGLPTPTMCNARPHCLPVEWRGAHLCGSFLGLDACAAILRVPAE